jgi:hypothetical protein
MSEAKHTPGEYLVRVTQFVRVKLDESKFDAEFMREFRESFYQFRSIEEHARHLAQLEARGVYSIMPRTFIEGYGRADEMGISVEVEDFETEIEGTQP